MATLVELASQIVTAQATTSPMSTEQVLNALSSIHIRLKQLESGSATAPDSVEETPEKAATITVKDAFKKNEIICMECGKGGFKTLARHLSISHNMKSGEYRKKFGIPAKQSLAAKSYSESRRQMAITGGLAQNLEKARAVRQGNLEKKKAAAAAPKASGKAPGKAKAAKSLKAAKSPKPAKGPKAAQNA